MKYESAWLFGDLGRQILGPNALNYLARSISGFAAEARGYAEKVLGGKPGQRLSVRFEERERQIAKFAELLESSWRAKKSILMQCGFLLPHDTDTNLISLAELPWTNETWVLFSDLSMTPETPITALEGLNWSDVYSDFWGHVPFLDIVQMTMDWLPFACSNGMLVNPKADLSSAANQFQAEICLRAGLSDNDSLRYEDLLARRNGWGIDAETVDQISDEYHLSRERIRQIEAKLMSVATSRSRRAWPILEQIAETQLPNKLGDPDDQLQSLHGLNAEWSIASIRTFMEISGSPHLADRLFANVYPSTEESREQNQILMALRKARSDVGVIKLDNIFVPELKRTLSLEEAAGVTKSKFGSANIFREYAIVSNAGNTAGIYSAVALQLGVCSPLHVDQVMHGVTRAATQRNSQNTLPDRESFIALLRQSSDFKVSETFMVSGREQEYEAGTIQRWIVDQISSQQGFVISKAQLFRSALLEGTKLSSLNNYVSYHAAIRSPRNGFLTLVGYTPSNADIDFAKRVADAVAVPNSKIECRASGPGVFIVEFTFSTNFLLSGVISPTPLLIELFGQGSKKTSCCSDFESDSKVKITSSFLSGLSQLKDHMLYDHGYAEGDQVRLQMDDSVCRVLI